jgi:hypothetical protein
VNAFGIKVFYSIDTSTDATGAQKNARGVYRSSAVIPRNLLNIGQYVIHVGLDSARPQVNYDALLNSCYFSIVDQSATIRNSLGGFVGIDTSKHVMHPQLEWRFEQVC